MSSNADEHKQANMVNLFTKKIHEHPNLQKRAYTAANLEVLLEQGAREYVNHPRGVSFQGKKVVLSGIYDWFQEDFGGSEEGVVRHLRRYAAPELAEKLEEYSGRIGYEYDWSLNE